MNLAYTRSERVAELIHREIAQIILRQVQDPRLRTVIITQVKLSPDLRAAKIFVSSMDKTQEQAVVLKGLSRARRFIRGELGRNLQLRVTPEIVFKWDDSVEYSFHIAKRIADLNEPNGDPTDLPEDK